MRIELVRTVKYSADLENIYENFDWEDIRAGYDLKPWEGMSSGQVQDSIIEEITNMMMSDIDDLLSEDDDDFDINVYGGL